MGPKSDKKKLSEVRVSEVMKSDVVELNPRETVHDALERMVATRVTAMPVTDVKGRCVGILSASDLIELTRDVDADLEASLEGDEVTRRWLLDRIQSKLGREYVEDVMTDTPATVDRDTPLLTAVREMLRNRIHRLPVTNGQSGKMVGIVSTIDVLEAVAKYGG